jgi:hypothetical protein
VSSPSRLYNILAAGKGAIAVIDRTSHLAQLIEKEQVAWSVQRGDAESLVRTVEAAPSSDAPLSEMNQRARRLAESSCSLPAATKRYEDLRSEVSMVPS